MENQSTKMKQEEDLQPFLEKQVSSRKTVAAMNELDKKIHDQEKQLSKKKKNKKNDKKTNKEFQEIRSSLESDKLERSQIQDEMSVLEKTSLRKLKNMKVNDDKTVEVKGQKQINQQRKSDENPNEETKEQQKEDNELFNPEVQNIEIKRIFKSEQATIITEQQTKLSSDLKTEEEIPSFFKQNQEFFKTLSQASENKEKSLQIQIDFLYEACLQSEEANTKSRKNLHFIIQAYQNQETINTNLLGKFEQLQTELNKVNKEVTQLSQKFIDIETTIMKSSLADIVYNAICKKLFKKTWSEFSSSQQNELNEIIKQANWRSFNKEAKILLDVNLTQLTLLRKQKDENDQFHKSLEYIIENKEKVRDNPKETDDSKILFLKCLVAMQKEEIKVELEKMGEEEEQFKEEEEEDN